MDREELSDPGTGGGEHPPAGDTLRTILSMPAVRYPAAVAAVLVAAYCAVALRDERWLRLTLSAIVLLFLATLASGVLSRLTDAGKPPAEKAIAPPDLPAPAWVAEKQPAWGPQARKIERDKALYVVGAILRRRGERSGSSREIWETEIAEFEAYLAERFTQIGKTPPADLRAKILLADRDAASHGDYREGLAGQFARILEG